MRFTQIRLRNWKNFHSADVQLMERMFLVGPNASGKSNFLDAFRFLRDVAKPGGGMQKAVEDRGGLSKIRCLSARKKPEVEVAVNLVSANGDGCTQWLYQISIRQEARGHRRTLLAKERVEKNGEVLVDRPDAQDKKDDFRLTQTFLEQINVNERFREIADYLAATQYLHLVPQLVRLPHAFTGPDITGDPFGRRFLERIALTPERQKNSRLKKIEGALRVAVPQFSKLRLEKDKVGKPHLEVLYEHWRPQGAIQREDQMSDGTLRFIGLLWSLLEGGSSLLLLEEPELSLHAAVVRLLPGVLHNLQRAAGRQIFISTHSADLLSDKGIGGEEVLMLCPDANGTQVSVASQIREIRELLENGFTVAETALPRTEPSQARQLLLDFARR